MIDVCKCVLIVNDNMRRLGRTESFLSTNYTARVRERRTLISKYGCYASKSAVLVGVILTLYKEFSTMQSTAVREQSLAIRGQLLCFVGVGEL